jgi:hypothetical protein
VPFTGSHPAAILPFLRTPLPASALVIGSVAADVPYYFPVQPGWETHDPLAVVTVDPLIGAVVWLLWHGVLAAPALAAAPAGVRARLAGRVSPGLRARLRPGPLALAVMALVVGAATHVGWDAFTHGGQWGAEHIAALRRTVAGVALYDWAQLGSSVLGILVLAWWLRRWWRRVEPGPAPGPAPRWVWPAVLAPAAVAGALSALAAPDPLTAVFDGATRAGAVAGVVAVVLAVGWHVVAARAGRKAPRQDPSDTPASQSRAATVAQRDDRPESRRPG